MQEQMTFEQKIANVELADYELTIRHTLFKTRYPLKNMQVGEHFYVPCGGRSMERLMNSMTSCIANCRRKTGYKFVQHGVGGGIEVIRLR